MLGPYIKSRIYQGHRNVSKCRAHHNGNLLGTTRKNLFRNQFSMYEPKCTNILSYFGGPGGPSII